MPGTANAEMSGIAPRPINACQKLYFFPSVFTLFMMTARSPPKTRFDPARAPPSPTPRSPNALCPPLLRSYLLPSLQGVGNPFTLFFLLSHPIRAPERLSAAVVRPELVPTTQLYLKGPGDLALLSYSVLLFSFLRLVLSHGLFPALARRWGIRKAGKLARFGEQGYAVVYFAVYTLSTTPDSSALNPLTAHFWFGRRRSTAFFFGDGVWISRVLFYGGTFFSNAHARPCVDWRLASARNADAGSVRVTSCSPAKSRIRFVPGLAALPHGPDAHLLTFMGALHSWRVPRPGPNAGAYNRSASLGAILGHAESGAPMWTRGIEMRTLYGSWRFVRRSFPYVPILHWDWGASAFANWARIQSFT
ncbi:hypothetical protein B0H13DRAFT_2580534 [Mycena leptocephala]|nr:hypothetical protein B0H13DRAFT_2580534 [Mycena leptocephala]